ncbi:MAG: sterol desaturase [Flavobacteriaceae bacterium]|nr:sterol desaturase [Flavobacteriaceae bacterium]OUX39056.1 MAG: sterol desaturase [Flavobacteriaceae bacterium TMED265]
MEYYAQALLIAIPAFFVLVAIELIYGYRVKKMNYNLFDTLSSLSSGMTNVIKDSLGLAFVLVSYPFVKEQIMLVELESGPLLWIVAFVIIDFAGYWNHRLSHHVNIFWNQHVIHHSSEEFNLACALRQSISNVIGYGAVLLIPAAMLGVPQSVINVLGPLHLFGQFWYHTQHIGKLGWLEYIFVTPSQHRVHHAINKEYIDKNLGQIFCVWDRMFGTFQEELDEVPPRYGVLKPAKTWNPILINFQHFWGLLTDAWRTKSIWDKFKIWFMPTGWRPADVIGKYPREIISDVYKYRKYKTEVSNQVKYLVIGQFAVNTVLLFLLLANWTSFNSSAQFIIGVLLFLGIGSYSSLMDKNPLALIFESLRLILGVSLFFIDGLIWPVFMNSVAMIWLIYIMMSWVLTFYNFQDILKSNSSLTSST